MTKIHNTRLNIFKKTSNLTKLIDNNTVFRKNNQAAMSAYMEFLSLRMSSPTKTDLCLQHHINHTSLGGNKDAMIKNLNILNKIPHLKFLKNLGDNRLRQLYPQSYLIREKLIQDNRVNLENIKPKMNIFEKFKYRNLF